MSELWAGLTAWLTPDNAMALFQATVLVLLGLVVSRLLDRAVNRLTESRLERQQAAVKHFYRCHCQPSPWPGRRRTRRKLRL